MNWPWVSRKLFEAEQHLRLARKDVEAAKDLLLEAYREQISELRAQNEQLKALFDKTTAFEITEQTAETVTLKSKPPVISGGRAGWRARSAEMSDRTIPAPADSVQALEKRVAEAGGKT